MKIQFGLSSWTYLVSIDYSKVFQLYEQEKWNLEEDLKLLGNLKNENIDIDTLKQSIGLKKNDTIFVGGITHSTTEDEVR